MSTPHAARAPDFSWTGEPRVRAVMDALGARGEARFVGGCVRDGLLGLVPARLGGARGTTDIDVATTLTPPETTAALQAAGLAAHPTGVEHGTVTAVSDGLPIEVTTLRADVATDGRHAEVAFTSDWDQDWRRRDFRINALYLSADGELFDPADGRDDLAAGCVRFIGDPDERIAEDYLRILRFFRFTSRYAEAPNQEGLDACARGARGMGRLSRERVWMEVSKLFSTPRAPVAFLAADEAGVLRRVFEARADHDAFGRLHALLKGDVPPPLGLAALWPDAETDEMKAAFRPANEVLARVETAREATAWVPCEQGVALGRSLYRFGREAVMDAALLHAARESGQGAENWLDLQARARREAVPVFPVQGRDLLARGLAPGPAVGRALNAVEAAWLAAGMPDDPSVVARIVEEALA